jgi:DNA-binding SARP family transcriptional activator/predicted ATPase
MATLTIRLLGVPEVDYGEQPLSFRTRKVLALLIYLVVEGGMHSRESLMALLWPETESEKAAATLRGTLSRLRRALQPAGEVLVTEAGRVGFDAGGAVDVDLNWLAQVVAAADVVPDGFLALDRGEFLTGFSLPDAPDFDTWAMMQRQVWQRRMETAYDRLTQQNLDRADGAAAVETAMRWVARAPFSEAAYRRLMTAQALSGDRAAAIMTHSQCQAMLQNELGVTPARETADLAERIRTEPVAPGRARRPAAAPLPFVGRTAEHSQLAAAFREMVGEGTRAAVVIGAGGVGKTRLLEVFLGWAALEVPNVDIWQGRAFEAGGSLPFEPVIAALRRRLERENAPEDLLEDVWLAELSRLMPELRGRYPDLPPPMTGDGSFVRSRLFASVATLGSALAARQPAVLVLEDVQWADADTLDMVQYIAGRWAEEGAPVLLLLSVRQEEYAANAALRDWLSRLDRAVPTTRLLLEMLGSTAVQTLIADLAAPGADGKAVRAFAEWIWAETNGLPFFIEALLQMLSEQGILTRAAGEGGGYDFAAALRHVQSVTRVPLPPGVRDVICARLDHLDEAEAALLLAAAVLGRECSYMRLCRVAGVEELAALGALEALLNDRLLAETGTARRPYAVAHDRIREVVYSESSAARRRVLHRRALIDLEAAQAPAAECAFHAVASLLDEPALRHSLAAGDDALARHALQEGLAHYDRALEAARAMGEAAVPIAPLARLYQNRGRVLELTYHYEAALANYEEMLARAEARDDLSMKLAALTAECVIHATNTPLFDPPRARELGETALALARRSNDRAAEAKALWCLMLVAFYGGGANQEILAYGTEALAMARELGLQELAAYVQTNLAWAYFNSDQLEAARTSNDESRAAWEALGNLPMVADSHTIKTYMCLHAGEYDTLLAVGPEALRVSRSINNALHESMVLLNLSEAHCRQGRIGEALVCAEAAMALGKESTDQFGFHFAYYPSFINIYLASGALEQAEEWADKLTAFRAAFMPVFETYLLIGIVLTKIACGKLGEGEALLAQRLAALDPDYPDTVDMVPTFVADGYLQMALGNPEKALGRMTAVLERLHRVGSRRHLAEATWLKGRAYRALAKVGAAQEALAEAQAAAEASSERGILWQVLVERAELAEQEGERETADALREQAREVVRSIAEDSDTGELRALFLASATVRGVGGPW